MKQLLARAAQRAMGWATHRIMPGKNEGSWPSCAKTQPEIAPPLDLPISLFAPLAGITIPEPRNSLWIYSRLMALLEDLRPNQKHGKDLKD